MMPIMTQTGALQPGAHGSEAAEPLAGLRGGETGLAMGLIAPEGQMQ